MQNESQSLHRVYYRGSEITYCVQVSIHLLLKTCRRAQLDYLYNMPHNVCLIDGALYSKGIRHDTCLVFSTSSDYFRISDDAGFSAASSKALFMWEQPW